MRRVLVFVVIFYANLFVKANNACHNVQDDPQLLVNELYTETKEINEEFVLERNQLVKKIESVTTLLYSATTTTDKVDLLIAKDKLRDDLMVLRQNTLNKITKIRFIKGLQIIKLLYEKILSLDHHYSSVYTFSEINKMTNPHYYPEFARTKEILTKKRTFTFNMSAESLLGVNPLASATQAFMDLLSIDLSSNKQKEELKNLECMIDFSLSMYNELNTIYFETSYLQSSNANIKKEIEQLFGDFTSPVNYENSLIDCRAKDDWAIVIKNLNSHLDRSKDLSKEDVRKMTIDLEFSVDRLLQLITVYNDFINEGELFYRKFKTILTSYQNADQCKSQLPIEYAKLKNDVDKTLEKFEIAYKPVEINGSKMKEILYGINEYQ